MNWNCKHRGTRLMQAGFGLIEIIISVAIISILALSVAFYSSTTELAVGDTATANFDCLSHSASVLDEILSRGGPTRVPVYSTTWNPWMGPNAWTAGSTTTPADATDPNGSGILRRGLLNNWPASAPAILSQAGNAAGTPPSSTIYAANGLLIDDRMRFLSLLYNNPQIDFCGNFGEDADLNTTAASTSGHNLKNLVARLRIRPYDLTTGALVGCTEKPLWIYPRNRSSLNTATPNAAKVEGYSAPYSVGAAAVVAAGPKVFNKPIAPAGVNYRNDRGFEVSLSTSFVDSKGNTRTCTYTQRFAHQLDDVPPARPSIALTVTEPTLVNGSATAHRNTARLTIVGSSTGTFERGTILVCRDQSMAIETKTQSVECYYNSAVLPAPGPGPQAMGPPPAGGARGRLQEDALISGDANSQTLANMGINAYRNNNNAVIMTAPGNLTVRRPNAWGTRDWVRCEQVKLCGQTPSASSVTVDATGNPTITVDYTSSIRSECVVRVEVAAMDAAGNLHTDPTAGPFFNSLKLSSASVVSPWGNYAGGLVTPRPVCGTYCAPGAFWPGGATGYYVSQGGCCTGVGCVRGRNSGGIKLSLSTDPVLPP